MMWRLLEPDHRPGDISPRRGYELLQAWRGDRWHLYGWNSEAYYSVIRQVSVLASHLADGQQPLRDEDRLSASEVIAAVGVVHLAREELDRLEADLLDSARVLGIPWERLAPALEVADRRAAQKRAARLWTRFSRKRRE